MKTITVRNLLMLFVALVLSVSAVAEDNIKGSAPEKDKRFGLYNVEKGQFVDVSANGLALSSGHVGLVTLTSADPDNVNTGSYELTFGQDAVWTTFQGTVGVGEVPANGNKTWMFNLVDAAENIYTMGCRDNDANAVDYLYYSTMNSGFALSYEEPNIAGTWKLVAEEDLPWLIVLDETSAENTNIVKNVSGTEPYIVHLVRKFSTNMWNTLCLPFSLTSEQLKGQFGDDVQLVAPGGYDETKHTVLFYDVLKDGLEAGHTYLVKPSQPADAGFYTFDGILPNQFVETPVEETIYGNVKFTASYDKTTAPAGKYVINQNRIYHLTSEMTMKGFRAWFAPVSESQAPIYFWAIDEDDPTGIEEVFKRKGAVDIYSIGGTLVRQGATSTQGLLKGVYVVDGQKVLVK